MGRISEYDDLEQEILFSAGKQIAEQIDRDIVWGLLEEIGWTKVEQWCNDWKAVDIWLAENCRKQYHRNQHYFIFEDAADASWFILKWHYTE